MLVCPRSHQPLDVAPAVLVAQLRAWQGQRALRQASGDLVAEPFEAGVVTRDGRWFYASRGGVLDLRTDAAVALTPIVAATRTTG